MFGGGGLLTARIILCGHKVMLAAKSPQTHTHTLSLNREEHTQGDEEEEVYLLGLDVSHQVLMQVPHFCSILNLQVDMACRVSQIIRDMFFGDSINK